MKKLFHWIACHTVLLVVLAFLVVAIIFREPLFGIKVSFPEDKPTESQSVGSEPVESEPVISVPAVSVPEKPEKSQPELKLEQPEVAVHESPLIQSETADEIQRRKQYDFRPPGELPVEDAVDVDLLQQARKAYWNEQLDSAQKLYRDYIAQDPANPDGYGELGNLLSTVGELDEAAIMYRKATDLLIQQGKLEQAEQLQKVLESIRVIQTTNQ